MHLPSKVNFRISRVLTPAALLLLAAAPAFAQDQATLDLLVKKNIITQDEANSLAKSSGVPGIVAGPKDANVKSLKIEGLIQAQYDGLSTDDSGKGPNPSATNEFLLRRVYLGAVADLGNGWGGEVLLDFAGTDAANAPASGPGAANATIGQNLFEKVIITKQLPDLYGTATLGYRKVDFTQEEITPSSQTKAIERSVLSRYFDENYGISTSRRLGFADRHTGIYWNGTLPSVLDGFYYSAAVTNGQQNTNLQYSNVGALDKFAGWAALGQKGALGDVKYDVGVNFGYTASQNSLNAVAANATTVGNTNQSNSEWGYNPYVRLDFGNFELAAEFEQATVDGGRQNIAVPVATTLTSADVSTAHPYGFQITPSYKITPEWEVALRYAYLSTNGRGTTISDVVRDAPNTLTADGTLYDNVNSFYGGVNWYIEGTSVKLSLGYEFDQFSGRQTGALGTAFNGPHANAEGLRAQLQLTF
jgi:hypothetical protein